MDWTNSADTWKVGRGLLPTDAPGGLAGYSLALSGSTAVMGAPNQQVGSNAGQGVVDVYKVPPVSCTSNFCEVG